MAAEHKNEENCIGWAARDESGFLSPYQFSRRSVGSDDISIKITHCGVCYADVLWTRNKFGDTKYPIVPGHEIAGVVKEVGPNAHGFKVGDHVGVGTFINLCRECENCNDGIENCCSKGAISTFNKVDVDGSITKGGYSSFIVVHQREEEMREVSEKTNARVAWFSIMSLGICITAAGFQVLYLKRYFRKKKLI